MKATHGRPARARGTPSPSEGTCLPWNRLVFACRAKPLRTRHCHSPAIVAASSGRWARIGKCVVILRRKSWLTSSTSESNAASASAPVASNRSSVPATAANIKIAKILLPSTRSLSLMTSIVRFELDRPLDEQVGRVHVHSLRIANHDGSDCFVFFVHQTAHPAPMASRLPTVHRLVHLMRGVPAAERARPLRITGRS